MHCFCSLYVIGREVMIIKPSYKMTFAGRLDCLEKR